MQVVQVLRNVLHTAGKISRPPSATSGGNMDMSVNIWATFSAVRLQTMSSTHFAPVKAKPKAKRLPFLHCRSDLCKQIWPPFVLSIDPCPIAGGPILVLLDPILVGDPILAGLPIPRASSQRSWACSACPYLKSFHIRSQSPAAGTHTLSTKPQGTKGSMKTVPPTPFP